MQKLTVPLLILTRDAALPDLLARVPGPYRPQVFADWAALRAAAGRAPPAAVAIVDAFGEGGEKGGLSEELRDLLREFPSLTVLASLEVDHRRPEVIRTLSAWGVADWLDRGRETTPAAVSRRLRLVRARPVQLLIRRAFPRGLPSRTRHLLLVAAEVVAAGGAAPELAAALDAAPRTIPRWLERADLPPPRRLLAWLRVLVVSDLLDDPGRSLESLARACGYTGAASLKTALRNLLDTTPRELRAAGAFTTVARAFADELFALRERSREQGKREKTWLN